ncbi:MAG: prolyl oligopeptidase family serine peptidase [Acidobacteria bacterium]|nr:prolyl oligopeptidase family serine peptidase [Acidobacteriota bacterium]
MNGALLLLASSVLASAAWAADFTPAQVSSFPYGNELTASAKGSRIAWALNEQGKRNLWVAEGPNFQPRQLTRYTRDDAQELTQVTLTPDGSHVVYVRGGDHGSNWDDSLPVNPAGDPVPTRVQVWNIPFTGGEPKSLGEGESPTISPDGTRVAYVRERQIWVVPIDGSKPAKRLFQARGDNGAPEWSPDGAKLAFVSARGDHSLIGVYAGDDQPITWVGASAARDSRPRWSPDGQRLVFARMPGTGGAPASRLTRPVNAWSLWIGEVATGKARQLYQSPATPRGSMPTTDGQLNLHWAAKGRIVFLSYLDGWPHLYSIGENEDKPLLLTPGRYMVEHVTLSGDGQWLFYSANAGSTPGDIERRHIGKAPVDRAAPEVLTPGEGLEWTPVLTGDQQHIAYFSATAQRPAVLAIMPFAGGAGRLVGAAQIPADFPTSKLVTPKVVTYKAEDGVEVHATLFDQGGTGQRPAIVFVHGGPPRQMLQGWHYGDYYAHCYAFNQYLASRGFVVLAINYRLGIGYGYDFHQPPAAGAQGASEYLDVKAAALYLRTRPEVDPKRIGVYGGSYGGYLTALALGRNSDLFAAGVDIHGVHDMTADGGQRFGGTAWRYEKTDSEQAAAVAWKSSPVSSISTWKSPVLLIHADDDRNVRFSQTTDLVRRLDAAKVEYELLVVPDDTHHWMRHANRLKVNEATAEFLERKLKPQR